MMKNRFLHFAGRCALVGLPVALSLAALFSFTPAATRGTGTAALTRTADDIPPNALVEVPATYPGGEAALLRNIGERLEAFAAAQDGKVRGQVVLRFVIEPTGRVGQVVVKKSLTPACDSAAVKAVRGVGSFEPARQNGQTISVWFTLPVPFGFRQGLPSDADADAASAQVADLEGLDQAADRQTEPEEEIADNALVEVPATYPGGEAALLRHISEHLVYPAEAQEKKEQGQVVLRFLVKPTGEVGQVVVKKSLTPACDREAIAVVKSLKRFVPARQGGRAVSVWFTLPIRFQLR